MNFKLNKFALVASLIVGFSAKAIPTPEAVEPAFDKDDNPTYIIKYGKGDRLKEDGTPLNLIQINFHLIFINLLILINLLLHWKD